MELFQCSECGKDITPDMPYHVVDGAKLCNMDVKRLLAAKSSLLRTVGCRTDGCWSPATEFDSQRLLFTCERHKEGGIR